MASSSTQRLLAAEASLAQTSVGTESALSQIQQLLNQPQCPAAPPALMTAAAYQPTDTDPPQARGGASAGTVVTFTLRFKVAVRGFNTPPLLQNAGQRLINGEIQGPIGLSQGPLNASARARMAQLHEASDEQWAVMRHSQLHFLDGEASASRCLGGRGGAGVQSSWALPLPQALRAAELPACLADSNVSVFSTETWHTVSPFDASGAAAPHGMPACSIARLRLGVPSLRCADKGGAPAASGASSLRLGIISCEGRSMFGRTTVEGHSAMLPDLELYQLQAGSGSTPSALEHVDTAASSATSGSNSATAYTQESTVLSAEAHLLGAGLTQASGVIVSLRRHLARSSAAGPPAPHRSAFHSITMQCTAPPQGILGPWRVTDVALPMPIGQSSGKVLFDVTLRYTSLQPQDIQGSSTAPAAGSAASGKDSSGAVRLRFSSLAAAAAFRAAATKQDVASLPPPSPQIEVHAGPHATVALGNIPASHPCQAPRLPDDVNSSIPAALHLQERIWEELQPAAGSTAHAEHGFAAVPLGQMEGGESYTGVHVQSGGVRGVFAGAGGVTRGDAPLRHTPAAASTKLATRYSWLVRT
jgi:hypothetical protein